MLKKRGSFSGEDVPDNFDEQMKMISQCPVCDARFNARHSQILEDREDAHLVYLHCKKCLHSVLAVIRFSMNGIASMGMVTDLTHDDVLRFKDGESVTADDVLLAHEALQRSNWQSFIL